MIHIDPTDPNIRDFGRSLTTPKKINHNVKELVKSIGVNVTPIYANVEPKEGARPNECFDNVKIYAEQHGGEVQYGWQIWEKTGVVIEAEFHAVWKNHEGNLVDITPKTDNEQKILFIPDSTRTFTGFAPDNIRMSLSRNPNVRAGIIEMERLYNMRLQQYKVAHGLS